MESKIAKVNEIENIEVRKLVTDGIDCWCCYHPIIGNSPSFPQEYFTEEDARQEFYHFFVKPTISPYKRREKEQRKKDQENLKTK
jgi:hypothetical protein